MEAAEPELQRDLVLMDGAPVPSAASPRRYLVLFLQVALRLSPLLFWIEIEREIRKERESRWGYGLCAYHTDTTGYIIGNQYRQNNFIYLKLNPESRGLIERKIRHR
jgi:hypothetical protein